MKQAAIRLAHGDGAGPRYEGSPEKVKAEALKLCENGIGLGDIGGGEADQRHGITVARDRAG